MPDAPLKCVGGVVPITALPGPMWQLRKRPRAARSARRAAWELKTRCRRIGGHAPRAPFYICRSLAPNRRVLGRGLLPTSPI